jgi:hypothetical protein
MPNESLWRLLLLERNGDFSENPVGAQKEQETKEAQSGAQP